MCFTISSLSTSAQATTWWYNNGVPDSVYLQTDVFSFRCFGGVAYTGGYDTLIIDSIIHRSTRPDAANDVFFDPSSTLPQRLAAVQSIDSTGQLEIFYLNISTTTDPFSSNNWYTLDNKILVNFTTTYPDSLTIDSFMNKYSLTLEYEPLDSLPVTTGCSYTYIFKFNLPSNQPNGFMYVPELLQDMFEDSTHVACLASPNVVNIRSAGNTFGSPPPAVEPQESFVYDMCGNGDPNDEFRDFQWYIHNDGFNEEDFFGGPTCSPAAVDGTVGADAKICECWNEGLSGQGVNVCIIATGDVYFNPNHADLQNQPYNPTKMWDCTGIGNCITLVSDISTGNGMRMGGIVANTKNNNFAIAGIAENAELSHIKIGNDFTSDASMVKALQVALVMNVDIIATEYVSSVFSGAIMAELRKHNEVGREYNHGVFYGTIIISPTGHQEAGCAGTVLSQFPARYNWNGSPLEPEVIGVIASNEYDKLQEGYRDHYNCIVPCIGGGITQDAFPSNFGSQYDIAAPGTNMFWAPYGNTWMDRWTRKSQDGDMVAIVAGVVALLLEDKFHQGFLEMRDRLRSGADKVGGYNYLPPLMHSNALAAGRINCLNSLLGWPLSTSTIKDENQTISIIHNPENWDINFDGLTIGEFVGTLYDMNGSVINKFTINNGVQSYSLSHKNLSAGLYIINLSNSKNTFTIKALK